MGSIGAGGVSSGRDDGTCGTRASGGLGCRKGSSLGELSGVVVSVDDGPFLGWAVCCFPG